jgi:hypothetical protein
MPRGKKKSATNGAAAKPAGGFRRGRVGPEERAQILEAAAAGTSIGDASTKFKRSEKIIQAVLNGTAGSSKRGPKAKKAAKGKPGRPRKIADASVSASAKGLNLRQVISDIVAQEVKKQLQQAFQ